MRILVIEDERKVASFIKRGLEEERYIVELAADGQMGIDMAVANHFDAIVLDVMLPKKRWFCCIKRNSGCKKIHTRHYAHRKSRHQ